MIPNLPLWSIRPNWANGITERLDWLTNVLTSTSGAEQRRATRVSPRRSFEITVNPLNQERSLLDLFLHRLGSNECLYPLWHDQGKLSSAVFDGDDRLTFDNTYREFVDGGWAVIYKDAFTYEIVEIASQDDDGVDLADVLIDGWPKGTPVYPLRRATLPVTDDLTASALTGRVGESVLLFTMTEENDFDEDLTTGLSYMGRSVITIPPNREASLDLNYVRMVYEQDNQTGRRHIADDADRAFTIQAHNWQVNGREARWNLRRMLYGLRGRQKSVWLPTFNDDIVLARSASIGATSISIKKIGFEYVGGPGSGREYVKVGNQVLRITGTTAPLAAGEERLTLSAPLAAGIAADAPGSFLDVARMDQDSVEITHHVDSDGVMEVTSVFRTFKDSRDASGINQILIPAAVKSPTGCGVPDNANNPCNPVFLGWFLKVTLIAVNSPPGIGTPGGWMYHTPSVQFYPPRGKFVRGTNNNWNVYEKNNTNVSAGGWPNLLGQPLVTREFQGGNSMTYVFWYDFDPAVFPDGIFFNDIRAQYPAGSWQKRKGRMHAAYSWWDGQGGSLGDVGWTGSLWPENYSFTVPQRDRSND